MQRPIPYFDPESLNFLAAIPPRPAAELFTTLKAANVHVMMFDIPGTTGALRVSIGSQEELAALVAVLEKALR